MHKKPNYKLSKKFYLFIYLTFAIAFTTILDSEQYDNQKVLKA